jgi:hypothetical protein
MYTDRNSCRIVFDAETKRFLDDYKKQYKFSIQDFVTEAVQEKIWKVKIEKEIGDFDRSQSRK